MIIDKQYGPFSVLIEDPLRKRKEEPSATTSKRREGTRLSLYIQLFINGNMNAVTITDIYSCMESEGK